MKRWCIEHGEVLPGVCGSAAIRHIDDEMTAVRFAIMLVDGQLTVHTMNLNRPVRSHALRPGEYFYVDIRERKPSET